MNDHRDHGSIASDALFDEERRRNRLRGVSLRVVILGGLSTVVVATLFGVSLSVLSLMRESAERERRQAAEMLALTGAARADSSVFDDERIAGAGHISIDPTLPVAVEGVQLPIADEALAELRTAFLAELDGDGAHTRSWLVTNGERQIVALAWAGEGDPDAFVVVLSMESFDARIASAQSLVLLYLGLVGLAVLGLGYWFLTRTVVRPVNRLMDATERIAAGDLETRVRRGGIGEIAALSERFDTMVRRVRESREAREDTLGRLASTNTELREANADLERARDELVRAERMATVGQLSAGIAHEIGNPLASIRAYVDLLRDEPEITEEMQAWLATMRSATDRMDRTIRELLDYSRADEGEVFSVSPAAPVGHAVNLVAPQKRLRGIDVSVAVPDDTPAVPMDESSVVQILVNLILNAADALHESGAVEKRIEVSWVAVEGESGQLEVTDNGPGIPAAVRKQIFEPFYTTKRQGEGTGLGLAISERLAARMGARLELDTRTPGTTFRLVFARGGGTDVHADDSEDAG